MQPISQRHSAMHNLLSVDEALASLLEHARPLTDSEELPLSAALGRICAAEVQARVDMPPADNSAVDGYALAYADLHAAVTRLPVSQRICAGAAPPPLAAHSAARIFTGALLPEHADTVVAQEDCQAEHGNVSLPANLRRGANVRRRSEDFHRGQALITPGTRLLPHHLGLAAAGGHARLRVYRRLRVAVLCTGSELLEPGAAPEPGKIYNANRYTLTGLLHSLGCDVIDLGSVPDDLKQLETHLAQAAQQADVILTSGAVSVGEEDHVKTAVQRLGELALWRVAIKPGKPFMLGRVGATPLLGLPGNPVSVFITFCILARPYLLTMQGATQVQPQSFYLPAAFQRPAARRREYARARMGRNSAGATVLELHAQQGSGVLSATTWAHGLAVLPEGRAIQPGDLIAYLPYTELLG